MIMFAWIVRRTMKNELKSFEALSRSVGSESIRTGARACAAYID